LDRDYRCDDECAAISEDCSKFCEYVTIHKRKEIENFLLVPHAIDRAAAQKVADRSKRSGVAAVYNPEANAILDVFCESKKSYVTSKILTERRHFERTHSPGLHESQVNEMGLDALSKLWSDHDARLNIIPGKDALSVINQHTQELYGVSVTATAIIDAMHVKEIPDEMVSLVDLLKKFSLSTTRTMT
jgi:hypothetical protein